MGIVPDTPLARQFRDLAGRLHQLMAGLAEQVFLVTAGIPPEDQMTDHATRRRREWIW